jgi:hypothetical protein
MRVGCINSVSCCGGFVSMDESRPGDPVCASPQPRAPRALTPGAAPRLCTDEARGLAPRAEAGRSEQPQSGSKGPGFCQEHLLALPASSPWISGCTIIVTVSLGCGASSAPGAGCRTRFR